MAIPAADENKEPLRGGLTKKFFLGLPKGVYLVSNLWDPSPLQSVFAERVVAKDQREYQWRKIVEAGASYRSCWIFDSPEDHHTYFNKIIADMIVEESKTPENQ
jgi:hypothetical protein